MTKTTGKVDFRLLRYFTLTSLVAFVAVAFMLGYIFRTLSVQAMLESYENEHSDLARVIANEMWDQDFAPYLQSVQGKSAAELRAGEQMPALHRKVQLLFKGTQVFKIELNYRSVPEILKVAVLTSKRNRNIGTDCLDFALVYH